MKNNENNTPPVRTAVEIFIRIALLVLLIAWCFQILHPFSSVILWGIILALALAPLFDAINTRLNNSPKWTATIIIVIGLFTGAIVLSLGYRMFIIWLDEDNKSAEAEVEIS